MSVDEIARRVDRAGKVVHPVVQVLHNAGVLGLNANGALAYA